MLEIRLDSDCLLPYNISNLDSNHNGLDHLTPDRTTITPTSSGFCGAQIQYENSTPDKNGSIKSTNSKLEDLIEAYENIEFCLDNKESLSNKFKNYFLYAWWALPIFQNSKPP